MSLPRDRIDALLEEIEQQRRVVDRELSRPARWSGPVRRELTRGRDMKRRRRVAAAFNHLAGLGWDQTRPEGVTVEVVMDLHRRVTGDGGAYRTTGARVGRPCLTAHHPDIPQFVEAALARSRDGVEPPLLAATRLHMDLLLIHPFADGNGRTARLASTWMLMAAGYRSTLFTAVEQHSRGNPRRYFQAFREMRNSFPLGDEPWLVAALEMMRDNSRYAAGFLAREQGLRQALEEDGVDRDQQDQALLDYDLARPHPHPATALLAGKRFVEVMAGLSSQERGLYRWQLQKITAEAVEDLKRRRE
jgi:hypothetical protein